MSDLSDEDIVSKLSGFLHRLQASPPPSQEELHGFLNLIRLARDQFLYPSLDPRIRQMEMWVLVAVESSKSKTIPSEHGPPVHRTSITDPIPFHLAMSKLHQLHEEGMELRAKREAHIKDKPHGQSRTHKN